MVFVPSQKKCLSIQLMQRSRKQFLLLSTIAVLVTLFNADYTALGIALVTVAKSLNSPISDAQWMLSGYSLAWAACSIPGGKLVDKIGSNKSILIGIIIFCMGSLLAGIALVNWFLILSRVIQAIGAAICLPAIYEGIIENIEQKKQKFAFGLISSAAALGLIIGPVLAGIMIRILSWRLIFFINLPIMLFAFYIFYPNSQSKKPQNSEKFSFVTLLTFLLTTILIVFSLNDVVASGMYAIKNWILLVITITTLIIFLVMQKRSSYQIIRPALFRTKSYLGSVLLYVITTFDFIFMLIIFTMYLQVVKNYSAYQSGLIFICFTGLFGCISLITPILLKKFPIIFITFIGELLITICFVSVLSLTTTSTLTAIIVLQCSLGAGLGLLFPSFNAEMASCLPKSMIGEGTGLFLMIGLASSSFFTSYLTNFLNYWTEKYFFHMLDFKEILLSFSQKKTLLQMFTHSHINSDILANMGLKNVYPYLDIFKTAFCHNMHNIAKLGITLNIVALIVIMLTLRQNVAPKAKGKNK